MELDEREDQKSYIKNVPFLKTFFKNKFIETKGIGKLSLKFTNIRKNIVRYH